MPSRRALLVFLILLPFAVTWTTSTMASARASVTVTSATSTGDREAVVRVPADHPRLQYDGRWEITSGHASTVNSGSRLSLNWSGGPVTAVFDLTGIEYPPHVYAVVDGRLRGPLIADHGRLQLTPPGMSAGPHRLTLVVKDVDERGNRWTRPFESALQLRRLEMVAPARVLEPSPAPNQALTFLGDSITQGVKVHCAGPGSACADGTRDYAYLVARRLRTRLEQVGFGAQGTTRSGGGGVPHAEAALPYNFEGSPAAPFDADVVVVNQGTNDWQKPLPEVQAAYADYLRAVLRRYPNARVIALEPFGLYGQGMHTGAAVRAAVAEVDSRRVHFVPTLGWLQPQHFSDPLHPNVSGHLAVADRLTPLVRDLLAES